MNIKHSYSRIDTHPTRAELAKFGATLLCAALLLAVVLRWGLHHESTARWLLAFGIAMSIGATLPGIGRILYVAWMGLGVTLGLVSSPVMLLGVYYLVFVPIGLAMKLIRRDSMRRKHDPQAQTYWESYPETDDPTRYIGQF